MFTLSSLTPFLSSLVRASGAATTRLMSGAVRMARIWGNRRAVGQLAELDEHALKDIGLSRTDVRGALQVSYLEDPSCVLADIAGASHGRAQRARSLSLRRAVVSEPRQADQASCEA